MAISETIEVSGNCTSNPGAEGVTVRVLSIKVISACVVAVVVVVMPSIITCAIFGAVVDVRRTTLYGVSSKFSFLKPMTYETFVADFYCGLFLRATCCALHHAKCSCNKTRNKHGF